MYLFSTIITWGIEFDAVEVGAELSKEEGSGGTICLNILSSPSLSFIK
jgi:hypothetical protein